jgi:penicillin-binding protein 2
MNNLIVNPNPLRRAWLLLILAAFILPVSAFSAKKHATAKKTEKTRSKATARTARNTKSSSRATASSARAARGKERPTTKRGRAAEQARIRREREEAARRAEIARQQAIARQRAADQSLRDESAANIAKDDPTGEDLEVRRIAVEALGNHAGSVVVMEPKTGRILSVVNQDWALRKGYKPCSTIKLVTGLAGLSEKVIDPGQTVNMTAASYAVDLSDSIAYSNNGYFQHVGGDVGFDKMVNYARQLGLGDRTGINHANEFAGRVPAFKSGYAVNHMSSHGDDFEVTPIQLGVLVSAIGNGGKLLVPHLPRTPEENVKFKPELKRDLSIPKETLQRMVPGMIGAVNYGTARLAYDPTETIAGKTGTCIGQGSWLGLFTSFAPVQDPQLAVVVVTRGSGERGKVAAGIAGHIYRALDPRYGRIISPQLANTPPKIDAKAAAAMSDEEDGDSDEADGSVNTTTPNTTGPQKSKVKSVIMPVGPKAGSKPAPAPTRAPVLKESAPDDIRIINEQTGNQPAAADDSTDQRPRKVGSKP